MKHEKYIQEKRNAKGEIFFRIYIPYKDENGVPQPPISHNVKANDFSSAKEALTVACIQRDKYLKQIRESTYRKSVPTLQDLWDKKFDYITRSVATQHKHRNYWNGGIKKYATKRIDKITIADIQKSVNDFSMNHTQKELSGFVSCWRDFFKLASMLDVPVSDKTLSIIIPKSKLVKKSFPVTFSDSDFFKLLDILITYPFQNEKSQHKAKMIRYILIIGYYTGMRPAEIVALNPEDISNDEIKINKAVGSTSTDKLAIITTKTPQSIRTVPIHEELKPYLEELLKESASSPIIVEYDGSLFSIGKASYFLYRICKANDIQFHMYSLRHAFASRLVQNGISPRTTQDLLGHATFSMSVEYARSSSEERKQAISKIKRTRSL